jgi:hypothetical protein
VPGSGVGKEALMLSRQRVIGQFFLVEDHKPAPGNLMSSVQINAA